MLAWTPLRLSLSAAAMAALLFLGPSTGAVGAPARDDAGTNVAAVSDAGTFSGEATSDAASTDPGTPPVDTPADAQADSPSVTPAPEITVPSFEDCEALKSDESPSAYYGCLANHHTQRICLLVSADDYDPGTMGYERPPCWFVMPELPAPPPGTRPIPVGLRQIAASPEAVEPCIAFLGGTHPDPDAGRAACDALRWR